MPEEIDLQSVIEHLQRDNEALRLHILKMRNTPRTLIDGGTVRDFIIKHYIVISASILILFATLSFIDTVRSFMPDNKPSKE